jgi:arginyl-tRNA synthetase
MAVRSGPRYTPPTMTSTDIFATLRARTVTALQALLPDLPAEAFAKVQMEPPRDLTHGDMATNAALVVGKAPPRRVPDSSTCAYGRISSVPSSR